MIDLTSSLAGPICTQTLAALGADVIKIEHPAQGDQSRAWGPGFARDGSVMFFSANLSKRSLALDIKDARGFEVLLGLIDGADVFVQSMRPGAADRHGLGAKQLRARNQRLVYCSIGAYGHDGPLASQPGYDPLMQAFAGIISITGEPDRAGVRVGPSMVDIGTGMWAAFVVVTALYERAETGRGRLVDTALFETALSFMPHQLTDTLNTGRVGQRHGTAFPLIAPYQVFATADGDLMLAAGSDAAFAQVVKALGVPGLASDSRFRTNPDRVANRSALVEQLSRVLSTRPTAHWLEVLDGLPVAPVQDLGQVANHEQTKAVGIIQRIGKISTLALPLRVDGKRIQHKSEAPLLGEHSIEILSEQGYSMSAIRELVAAGVTSAPALEDTGEVSPAIAPS